MGTNEMGVKQQKKMYGVNATLQLTNVYEENNVYNTIDNQ